MELSICHTQDPGTRRGQQTGVRARGNTGRWQIISTMQVTCGIAVIHWLCIIVIFLNDGLHMNKHVIKAELIAENT